MGQLNNYFLRGFLGQYGFATQSVLKMVNVKKYSFRGNISIMGKILEKN